MHVLQVMRGHFSPHYPLLITNLIESSDELLVSLEHFLYQRGVAVVYIQHGLHKLRWNLKRKKTPTQNN